MLETGFERPVLLHASDNGRLYHGVWGGRQAVLKIPYAGSPEIDLLTRFAGDGALPILAAGDYRGEPAFVSPRATQVLSDGTAAARDPRALSAIVALLGRLHSEGWCHRDIHPGNILLINNKWVLADFGVAARAGEGGAGSYGLLRYASLAQIQGEPAHIAHDLYALLLTINFCVTGEAPWAGTYAPRLFVLKQSPPPELYPALLPLYGTVSGTTGLDALTLFSKMLAVLSL